MIVPLGITERVPNTETPVNFTLEQAWYSARQIYILYTVKADAGKHILPTWGFLGLAESKAPISSGRTDWNHLSEWGAFSDTGFHGVLIFERFDAPPPGERLTLTVRQWGPVTPQTGMDPHSSPVGRFALSIPWRAEWLNEPEPEAVRLTQQGTWLGRTLALEDLRVGIGRIDLSGYITLPPGESQPGPGARLRVGGEAREMKEFQAEPVAGKPGRYRFTAAYDGPDQWPAPVQFELYAIAFESDKVLEWPIPWDKYRDVKGEDRRLMDPQDQVTVQFYDSTLTSIFTYEGGVSIEQRDRTDRLPYVRGLTGGGGWGAGPLDSGVKLVNDAGEVLTEMGGSVGTIWDNGRDERQGFSADWGDQLPDSFRQSDRLVLRYVRPSASMILKESWMLVQ